MQFRLVYEGRLPAPSRTDNRADDKHRIRKVLHPQLKLLWDQHPALAQFRPPQQPIGAAGKVPNLWKRCDHRFMPIVGDWSATVCSLDILFLRREPPGELIKQGGDLDNRIKTLFDALRIPDHCSGVTQPEPGEDPFFVLLQDDRLITGFTISTDRLLKPLADSQAENDVLLVMNVSVRATKVIVSSPFPLG